MKMRMWIILLVLIAALFLFASVVYAGGNGNQNPGIYSADSNPHGRSYSEWGRDWWLWALAIPPDRNPLLDETGAFAFEEQSNCPVVFLAGNFGGTSERSITVKPGTTFYVPVLNFILWTPDDLEYAESVAVYYGLDPSTMTEGELLRLAANHLLNDDNSTIDLEIDGRLVVNPKQYYSDTPGFNIPDDDLLGGGYLPPDNVAAAVNYAVMVKPLRPGEHLIHYYSTLDVPEEPPTWYTDFWLEITYHITVQPGAPSPCAN